MAFPEPTPVIRGRKNAEEFYRQLRNFKLTEEQLQFYREGIELHKRVFARDPKAPDP